MNWCAAASILPNSATRDALLLSCGVRGLLNTGRRRHLQPPAVWMWSRVIRQSRRLDSMAKYGKLTTDKWGSPTFSA